MSSIIVFLIVLSVLILVHEFGHFIFAKRFGIKVEVFSLGFGNKLFCFKRNGTEYRVSCIPLGGYIKMAGETPYEADKKGASDEFVSKPAGQRAAVLVAGPVFNYILGFLLFAFIFLTGSPQITSLVGGLVDDYPAKAVGIKLGDRITQLNGKDVYYWEEILDVVRQTTSGSISLKAQRAGKEFAFVISPKPREFKNIFGQQIKIGLLGISPSSEVKYVRHAPIEAVALAAKKTWNLTQLTYFSLWRMMTGAMSFKESVAGPIGIFMVTQKAAIAGLPYLLGIMAVLSISLAIFNLLPIPVLDGGHLFFLLIEKIFKRPVSEKVYERITQIGMALLITFMIFVMYNDAAKAGWIAKIIAVFTKQ